MIDIVCSEFFAVDVHPFAVEQHLVVGDEAFGRNDHLLPTQPHHLLRNFAPLQKIDTLLDPADRMLADRDLGLVVVVFAPLAVGKVVACQLLDAVLSHVADYQHDEEWPGEVSVALLEVEADDRGKDHRKTRGDAQVDLFDHHAVAFLRDAQVERTLDILLQDAVCVDQVTVFERILLLDLAITHLFAVVRLLTNKRRDHLHLLGIARPIRQEAFEQSVGGLVERVAHKLIAVVEAVAHLGRDARRVDNWSQRAVGFEDPRRILAVALAQKADIARALLGRGDVQHLLAQGTLEDRRKDLDLRLILGNGRARRIARHALHRRTQSPRRGALVAHDVAHEVARRNEAHIRLHIAVEVRLRVGRGVDVERIGHKDPHIDRKVVQTHLATRHEPHLELDGELIVNLGRNINHSPSPLARNLVI